MCSSDLFVPWHWGANQKGMQAGEECNAAVKVYNPHLQYDEENSFGVTTDSWTREDAWRLAAADAADRAEAFSNAGYHKQIANRLIEPFSFIDTLITSTSWANFRHLRDHEAAEPHFQDLAKLIGEAIDGAHYEPLEPGQWHLPYVCQNAFTFDDDVEPVKEYLRTPGSNATWTDEVNDVLKRLSVARCARISYKPFDGDASIEKELERYDMLVGSTPLHASPAEHQATPDVEVDNRRGGIEWAKKKLAGNLGPGWIQYRKTLAGEYVPDAA